MRTATAAILASAILAASPLRADEQLAITPAPSGDVIERYHLDTLTISTPPGGGASITVQAIGIRADGQCAQAPDGECVRVVARYEGAVAIRLVNQLNKMDFSTISLRRRLYVRLQADGYLPVGIFSGAANIATLTPTRTAEPTPTQ